MFKNLPFQRIFCVGIGGIGVSGLAELLHTAGYQVSGSDTVPNELTTHLQSLGMTVYDMHSESNIAGSDLIIYTSAVDDNNPEIKAAKAASIPLLSRGEVLARVMQADCNIVVTGTHGKTTTTSLMSYVFEQSDANPTCLIGGVLQDRVSPFHQGGSQFFVAEADESDGSFLFLSPTVAIITNIDFDHMETYAHDFEKLKNSFLAITQKIPSNGFVVACIDDPVVHELLPQVTCKVVTYGQDAAADYQMADYQQLGLESCFVLLGPNQLTYSVKLHLPGAHNALNAVAALVSANELGLSMEKAVSALAHFPGVGRRFQFRGEIGLPKGVALLFDDYGHHPIELRATLNAAKLAWPDRRLIMVFQPHRYSRTRDLMAGFVDVLKDVDYLVLTEVYAASEEKITGADGVSLFELIKKAGNKNISFVPKLSQLRNDLTTLLQPNDVVILQGAGNIVAMADEILALSCGT